MLKAQSLSVGKPNEGSDDVHINQTSNHALVVCKAEEWTSICKKMNYVSYSTLGFILFLNIQWKFNWVPVHFISLIQEIIESVCQYKYIRYSNLILAHFDSRRNAEVPA